MAVRFELFDIEVLLDVFVEGRPISGFVPMIVVPLFGRPDLLFASIEKANRPARLMHVQIYGGKIVEPLRPRIGFESIKNSNGHFLLQALWGLLGFCNSVIEANREEEEGICVNHGHGSGLTCKIFYVKPSTHSTQ